MTLKRAAQGKYSRKGGKPETTWKDKVDRALMARRAGKELRKGKRRSLTTSLRTKL